jgi:AcrR family transcriptional regulator
MVGYSMYIRLESDSKMDPRVLRTRELLINSFAKLLVERKSIRKISVQSVTKLAGVNRVTFYAHFTDKYDLLDTWARLMFQQSVIEKLPEDANFTGDNLTLLINATLDFCIYRNKYRRRINEQFESMFEAAIQQELRTVLSSMLKRTLVAKQLSYVTNLATFLSWAIFGCLFDWSRIKNDQSQEAFATEIVNLCESVTLIKLERSELGL